MNTPDFDARAKDIVNGYGYLCADRMNDWNILQFASIVSAALSQAFEDGKLLCQATVTAGGTASSAPVEPLQTDEGGDAMHRIGHVKSKMSQRNASRIGVRGDVCEKCNGAGWLWWHELDEYHGTASESVSDDTRYLCDGDLHKATTTSRQIEEPEQREGDEPGPQVETLA